MQCSVIKRRLIASDCTLPALGAMHGLCVIPIWLPQAEISDYSTADEAEQLLRLSAILACERGDVLLKHLHMRGLSAK